jgi:ABC-type sugar transport system ATPase subunit
MDGIPLVEFVGVTKRYGATFALREVDLAIHRGTVHALVGENGAGKSTLGKVLAGVVARDAGHVLLDGVEVTLGSPRRALAHGVSMIAQEIALVPGRSVVENVYLGVEDHAGPWVRRASLRRRFEVLAGETGIHVPPDAVVGTLRPGDQQKVEILRAVARKAQVIVMDEPTARLTAQEAEVLHRHVRSLTAAGRTVVYVSHFLGHVLELATTVTVMRDGRIVRTGPASAETHDTLVEGMTGYAGTGVFPPKSPPVASNGDGIPVLEVTDLSREPAFAAISFDVRAGEVVALAGLVGSGRSEVVRAIYGAEPPRSGQVRLDGAPLDARRPRAAISRGVALVPESRKDDGLLLGRSVLDNVTLPYLSQFSNRVGLLQVAHERELATERATEVGVQGPSMSSPVTVLSGGNQQKVLFARALLRRPRLLIVDEPTRGVSIGAKRAIYEIVTSLAAQGTAVLLVSSELDEVVGLAHRVLVMRSGRIAARLAGADVTERTILDAAFGVRDQARGGRP